MDLPDPSSLPAKIPSSCRNREDHSLLPGRELGSSGGAVGQSVRLGENGDVEGVGGGLGASSAEAPLDLEGSAAVQVDDGADLVHVLREGKVWFQKVRINCRKW